MLFPNAATHLQVPEHPLLSKTDILFYTSPVYSAASFSTLYIPVSYRSASGYTENGSYQRSLQAGFSALWLDISENDMPCSSLFLPLCFNIAANNLNRCRLIVLYHISHYRTSVLFCFLYLFLQFISHL